MSGAATGYVEIGPWQLVVALGFVVLALGLSHVFRLGLRRDLAVGTVRTFAQLFLLGYALRYIFELDMFLVVAGVFCTMMLMAGHVIRGRVRERAVDWRLPLAASMVLSYTVVSWTVLAVVVRAEPWWRPDYFIPIAGMVIGNSMNALAISLERLFSDLRTRREEVEMRLSLGATPSEASREMVRTAIRSGMIPSINSMMGVGLVFIPGMMTGQILSGMDPAHAVRYQIVVMLMLVASTALASIIAVLMARARCFGPGGQLLLTPE